MGKSPAFQFYPNDWNRDMEEYPLEIQGAWIVILCKLWWSETRGEATKSLNEWARILREKPKKTKKILDFFQKKNIANVSFLDPCLDNQNVTVTSRRMVRDHKISQIRRDVGKLGGNPGLNAIRQNRVDLDNQNQSKTLAKGYQKDQSPIPSPSPYPKNNTPLPPKPPAKPKFQLPGWVLADLWADFVEMRRLKKKPLTDGAKARRLTELKTLVDAGHDQATILKNTIDHSWDKFYAPAGIEPRPTQKPVAFVSHPVDPGDLYDN